MLDAVLVAASGTPGSPSFGDWTTFIQYGVLGLVAVGFVLGKIVPGYILRQRDEEVAQLKTENAAMRQRMEEQVIPALTRATDVMGRLADHALSDVPPRRRA